MRKYHIIPLVVVLLLGAYAVALGQSEEKLFMPSISGDIAADSSPTSTETPTPTSTETREATATSTPTPTATSTSTSTATPTSTPTPTVSETSLSVPTSTSTSTSTPTASPTLTPTPSPTATDQEGGSDGQISVLDNHTSFVDSVDFLHIAGEVKNDTGAPAEFVKVTANLFNAQNQLVDTDYTYTRLDILPPGETTCFEIIFLENPAFAYYTFEVSYSDTEDASLPIAVFGDSGSYNEFIEDWYEVIGQARNDSSVNAEFVKIVGTLYQSNGQILDCEFAYTNADVLTPSQVSTWKITFTHAPNGTVGTYRVQAQGREQQ